MVIYKMYFTLSLLLISTFVNAIVIRHDVADQKYHAKVTDFLPLATLYNIGVHGTLIDPQWVITAGHAIFCMEAGSKIKVGEQWVEIEARYSHKNYQLDEKNDIALLKLKQPITSITPANIYKNNDELGKSIWFIGSGGTGTGLNGQTINLKENNGVLRKAQNRIVDIDDTDIIFEFEKGDDGEPLEGVSGNGDSGGPAYIFIDGKYQLLGISSRADSWFKDVGEYGVREVYTRVSSYQTWISQVINGSAEQRDNITTQNRFLQDNMKGNIDKVCNMVGF